MRAATRSTTAGRGLHLGAKVWRHLVAGRVATWSLTSLSPSGRAAAWAGPGANAALSTTAQRLIEPGGCGQACPLVITLASWPGCPAPRRAAWKMPNRSSVARRSPRTMFSSGAGSAPPQQERNDHRATTCRPEVRPDPGQRLPGMRQQHCREAAACGYRATTFPAGGIAEPPVALSEAFPQSEQASGLTCQQRAACWNLVTVAQGAAALLAKKLWQEVILGSAKISLVG